MCRWTQPSRVRHVLTNPSSRTSNGFTIAATCSCSGQVVTGCNYDLWDMTPCPDNNDFGACRNPTRPSTTITNATAFFAPCSGMAYTYPIDDGANSFGACQSGIITCCIGSRCPPNPRQAKAHASAAAAAAAAPVETQKAADTGVGKGCVCKHGFCDHPVAG